jgi:hypothetical protein
VRRLAVLFIAPLVAAGCGGDQRVDAVKAAESWLRAVGDRDADRACELMSESAVDTIRKRSELDPATTCLGAVRDYSDAFERGDIDSILKAGLEAEGPVKDGQVGVFPVSGPREAQVILMRRSGDDWKVASMTVGPSKPEATPTPAS